MIGNIGKTVGTADIAAQTVDVATTKKSGWDTFHALRNIGMGLVGTFGGAPGAALSAQNELGNLVLAAKSKDRGERMAGMVSASGGYAANMLAMFAKTTPASILIQTQVASFNLAIRTEQANPGAWAAFKQDPMYWDAIVK